MVLAERTGTIRSVSKGWSGSGSKRGCSSAKACATVRRIVAGPGPLMRDLVPPEQRLAIAFVQRGEVAAGPEGFAHVTNGAFHAAFLIAGPHLAGPGDEVIMGAQLQQTRMEMDLIAAALQHGTAKIVVKNHARLSPTRLERRGRGRARSSPWSGRRRTPDTAPASRTRSSRSRTDGGGRGRP